MFRKGRAIRFKAGCQAYSAFSILLSLSSTYGQQVTGNLQGQFLDSLGQPVLNVNVVVRGSNVQGVRGGVSAEDGTFRILALPPGKISVTTNHVGYQTTVFENVSIQLGGTTSLGEIRLQALSLDLPEVVVAGERSLIDPARISFGANLRSREFENLPVERNYRGIASLARQESAPKVVTFQKSSLLLKTTQIPLTQARRYATICRTSLKYSWQSTTLSDSKLSPSFRDNKKQAPTT